jgi:carbon-monoxide dehydrogenase medium subunit
MSTFEYASPQSIEEAIAILSSRSEARPIAGGQKILLGRNSDVSRGTILVDLGRISALKRIDRQGGALRIGAMATLNEIASSDLVRKEFPILSEAAGTIGDAQLRNKATLGGNLAEGDPEYDLPALMLALDASIETAGSQGPRKITAEEYFSHGGSSSSPGQLIVSVIIPAAAANSRMAYVRMKHPARLTAVCAVAAVLAVDGGRISNARIALTGATVHPTRLKSVEKVLLSGPANGQQDVSEHAALDEGIGFRGDAFASEDYRRHLARVLTGRAIKQALSRPIA